MVKYAKKAQRKTYRKSTALARYVAPIPTRICRQLALDITIGPTYSAAVYYISTSKLL